MKKCAAPYCSRLTVGKFCPCCAKRIYRAKYPMKAAYQNLRSNAKRRGKEFTITLQDFEAFCTRTQYITYKGKTKDSFSIDRPKNHLGYTPDNMEILTLQNNSLKRIYVDYDYQSKSISHHIEISMLQMENAPF
jgi:hypothetical protein